MEVMRLVITGPPGAGKSTFIRTISEIEVVDTDRVATDETSLIKSKTTVAFDFGRINIGADCALQLYGTPGQERFDFMWDLLIEKAHAYVLLVAAHRPHEFRYARRIANFMNQRRQIPMLIGVTHTDQPEAWSEENIAVALGLNDASSGPPIIAIDPNDLASTAHALMVLVQRLYENGNAGQTMFA
jgi:uncharacterized protein